MLLILSVPIAFSLGLSIRDDYPWNGSSVMGYTANIAFNGVNSVPVMAIPFFISSWKFYESRRNLTASAFSRG